MSILFAKNIWEVNKKITKKDLINPKFDCDIFINEIKFSENIKLSKENNIVYTNFKKKYIDLSEMFRNCQSLTYIILFYLISIPVMQ